MEKVLGDFFDAVQTKKETVDLEEKRVSQEVKKNILVCTRLCLKTNTFFELFRESKIFDSRLLQLLADGEDITINREAWRLFYQLLSYHPGFVNELVKNGFIKTVLSKVHENADQAVMHNGLYYVNKIIENPERTSDKSMRPTRKDTSTFIKEFKVQECFMSYFNIYKLIKNNSERHNHLFPALAKLFRNICMGYLAQPLRKHLMKNKEYKAALEDLFSLFRLKPLKKIEGAGGSAPSSEGKSSPPMERKKSVDSKESQVNVEN